MSIDRNGSGASGIDEQLLMAYADGELAPEEAARVEVLLAGDPVSAHVVAAHRALRARLSGAYAGVLDEPVAPRLRSLLDAADPVRDATVVPLRSKGLDQPRWAAREWLAMAASVLVGVAIGSILLLPRQRAQDRDGWVDQHLVARDPLARALDRQLSGPAPGVVQIELSLRAADGRYCRAFTVRSQRAFAGLACRTGGAWQVTTLAEDLAAQGGTMRQASSTLPAAVLADIDTRIQGESLDAGAERDARDHGWRGTDK
jgi:hypothetical protein